MSEDPRAVRRVLLLLDFGAPSKAGLEAAVTLAEGAAELHGLFVEDEDLLRMAALPVTRVLGYRSAAPREISLAEMERELRAHAARAESLLRAAAERAKLGASFRVARGRVVAQVVLAAGEADLVLLDRRAHPNNGRRHALGPPALLYDGGPASARLLAATALLASQHGQRALVLVSGLKAEPAAREASEQLRARGIEARVAHLPSTGAEPILQAVRASGCGALVFRGDALAAPDDLQRLLEEAPLPILITP